MKRPLIWKALIVGISPNSVRFQLALTYCMCAWITKNARLSWHFEHRRMRDHAVIFFTKLKLHPQSMPDVTYDNEFYVHRSPAWHTSLSCNDKCGTSLSQIDFFFFIQWFLSWKNSCQCLLFSSCFARRYMPLSAIKQLQHKLCIGCGEPLVHQQCGCSFLTINI